jgi:hypothetical protein
MKTGDAVLEGYLQELFTFSIESFKIPSTTFKFHGAILNQIWHRILQESQTMKITCQNKVEDMVNQVIAVFLEESLRQEGQV